MPMSVLPKERTLHKNGGISAEQVIAVTRLFRKRLRKIKQWAKGYRLAVIEPKSGVYTLCGFGTRASKAGRASSVQQQVRL